MIKRKVILVSGQTGAGKSTLTKIIRVRAKRVITLDPMAEYDGITFTTYNQFVDYVLSNELYEEEKHFSIVIRFTTNEEIDALFQIVWDMGNVLLVVEEAESYLDPKSPNENFDRLVSFGRHQNISLLCISRRNVEVSSKYRAQITSLFTFRQSLKRDVEGLEDYELDGEKVKALHDVVYPSPPQENLNYLVYGEKLDDINFNKTGQVKKGKKVIHSA